MSKPRVSIITVCYNSGRTIADTVRSVTMQDYGNIEYLVIDGSSTDNTLEQVRSLANPQARIISEQDKGLYDALNKGIKLATGDIIGILHSDDLYAHDHVISDIVNFFENKNIDAVSSSVEIYRNEQFDKPFRVYRSTAFRPWQFRMGIQPPHPGFFIKRKMLDKAGAFNTDYRISADFDWLLRVIKLHRANVLYTDYVSVHMRDGGMSSSGFKSKVIMNRENLRVLRSHGIYSNMLLVYSKYFLKIFQLRI